LGAVAVAVAVASLVAAQMVLRGDRVETAALLQSKQAEVEGAIAEKVAAVERAGAALEDDMRKYMTGLGFNILILPEGQSLSELHLSGGLSATMPESYVDKLAASRIVTINHLLPSVTRRIRWEEQDREVILVGTRGEVPIMHQGMKKPLLDAVAPGKMVVGYEVHRDLGLEVGENVTLLGREFTVSTLHPQRGSEDDATIWIDLQQAQELLGMENLIHGILALECECAGDRISEVRQEIQTILPGTQVIERYTQALARAEARNRAKVAAETALVEERTSGEALLKREGASRAALESRHATLAATLVPVVMLVASIIVAVLALLNVRQRRYELGILRAIGLRSGQLLGVCLGKAVLMGLAGGLLGCLLGAFVGLQVAPDLTAANPEGTWRGLGMVRGEELVVALALAPLLAALASWIPALLAARQDPAVVLQGD
jgi:hypothetical protein